MKSFLRNVKIILILFLCLSFVLISGLVIQERRASSILLKDAGEDKNALEARYRQAGDILSRDGVRLAYSEEGSRHYAEDPELAAAALQMVGDYTHNISNTIENQYQDILLGSGRNFFRQFYYDVRGRGLNGDSIRTTLDSRIMLVAQRALAGRKGAVVVQNYRTGEVLAAVSSPNTLPQNIIDWEDVPDSALFNRALNGKYPPGSTFKVITSAAWISAPEFDPDLLVTCRRPEPLIEPDGVREREGDEGHGDVDLNSGFMTSCNYFFGTVGLRIGGDALQKMAENFAYNSAFKLDKLDVSRSVFEAKSQHEQDLTWRSIGQPQGGDRITTTPLQMCMVAGAVANHGIMMQPQIVEEVRNPMEEVVSQITPSQLMRSLPEDKASELCDVMTYAVDHYYDNVGISGYSIGGKTGSVALEEQENPNSMFIGFINAYETPYALAFVLEDSPDYAMDSVQPLFEALVEYKP